MFYIYLPNHYSHLYQTNDKKTKGKFYILGCPASPDMKNKILSLKKNWKYLTAERAPFALVPLSLERSRAQVGIDVMLPTLERTKAQPSGCSGSAPLTTSGALRASYPLVHLWPPLPPLLLRDPSLLILDRMMNLSFFR